MGSGEGGKWEQKSKGTRLLFITARHPIKTSSQQSFFFKFLLTSTETENKILQVRKRNFFFRQKSKKPQNIGEIGVVCVIGYE